MSVNKVILMGNVGAEPEYKEFEKGCIALITLATNKRGYKRQDGTEVPERTEWHRVVTKDSLAKVVQQYVKKGDKLYIEGELRTRSYTDANGVDKYVTEVHVKEMEMLTPKSNKIPVGDEMPF